MIDDDSTRVIGDNSAEGLALALNRMGLIGTVFNQSDGSARIELQDQGTHYRILIFTSSDGAHRAAMFTATFDTKLQYWESQAWCERHVHGRVTREEDGAATVQFSVVLDGITERWLKSCIETWSHTLTEFERFCLARTDRKIGSNTSA